jgi:hypothetical protein
MASAKLLEYFCLGVLLLQNLSEITTVNVTDYKVNTITYKNKNNLRSNMTV